jgi:transposase
MNKKYIVKLTAQEKQQLEQLLNQGKAAARKLTHARILLKANCSQEQGGWTDQAIHQAIDVSLSTIARVRQTFVEQGLDAALQPKPSSQLRLRKLDGVAEARLIACCCSQPPTGRKEWTLRLLADEMIKLDYVDSISHETVRQVLKKTKSSLG